MVLLSRTIRGELSASQTELVSVSLVIVRPASLKVAHKARDCLSRNFKEHLLREGDVSRRSLVLPDDTKIVEMIDAASRALADAPPNDGRTWAARADSSGVALTNYALQPVSWAALEGGDCPVPATSHCRRRESTCCISVASV